MYRFPSLGKRACIRDAGWKWSAISGFTLVELVTVMVIISVISAVAISRFTDKSGFEARGFSDQAVAAIQYARQQAVAQRRPVCVNVTGGGLTITRSPGFSGPCTAPLINPADGQNYTAPVPTGLTLAAIPPAMLPLTIAFDPAGRFAGPTLTLNVVGDVTRAVVVEAETGHVHSP